MTQEEKQLLLKDLCARLPYRINVLTEDNDKGHIIGVDDTENGVFEIHIIEDGDSYTCDESIENFKPYLRPMSSMTEEERLYFHRNSARVQILVDKEKIITKPFYGYTIHLFDWLNTHYFDYRNLISMGLALEAPEGMYKTE